MAPWTVSNNVLTATDSGDYAALTIYYDDYEVGSYMNNNASVTLPDWNISNNTIDAHGGYNGFYFYTYSSPDDNYDNASVHFGSMLIDNNTLNANKDSGMARGIDLWIEDICENCYDSSSATFGDITITNNTIYNADNTAINLDYDDVGYAFDNDGSVTMGNVKIADNMVDTAAIGIKAFYNWFDGSTIDNTAAVTLGTLDITGNTITNIENFGFNNGIVFDIRASIDAPTASLDIGKTVIADNAVTTSSSFTGTGLSLAPPMTANTSGIWINGDIGQDVVFAAPEVKSNIITEFTAGIGLDDLPEASIRCNTLQNNTMAGLFFLSDGNFSAQYNWLEDNVLGVKIDKNATATINAEKNWWGDPLGPVACATCNTIDAGGGTVDYEPWLTSRPATCGGGFPWIMYTPAITGMKPAK